MPYNGYKDANERRSSEEISANRIYALLYKLSSDIGRIDIMLRAIKKQTEEARRNEE
ncbi:MAG: hypothetical protein IJS90_02350 [Clostridia bacterium]|nr:hypothetical protein [Clostridia bacterium]